MPRAAGRARSVGIGARQPHYAALIEQPLALGAGGESFDFVAWLQRAVAQSWLKEVVPRADTG